MPEIVFTVTRFGFLLLLWVFVFAVVRTIRNDAYAASRAGKVVAAPPSVGSPPGGRRAPRVARHLVVTGGELKGRSILLEGAPITMGRAPDSTLVITDDYASSRHARLVPREGEWYLEDLNSTNGTYLDRAKVSGPTPVPLGVPIRIGRTSFELRP
ncbi:phosphopeptide-binding protein [Actinorhabdospora filicis]|uniref:Phosphopeptide-binding protein n=1 Tax=Actinorhabdospora filicis TaxID=1785913 RepID=A0A9W6SRX1_9ACTN|nr:FHA domain-containing protein [Actinorhabdospora filicis]GLZ81271.1 phosphopeptide-binding protein [Actinorhabdospora filicis]